MGLDVTQGGALDIAPHFTSLAGMTYDYQSDSSSVTCSGVISFDEPLVSRDWVDSLAPQARLGSSEVPVSFSAASETELSFSTELPMDLLTGSDELVFLFVYGDGEEEEVRVPLEIDLSQFGSSFTVTSISPETIAISPPGDMVEMVVSGEGFTPETVAGLKVTVRGWDPQKKEHLVTVSPPQFLSETDFSITLGAEISSCVLFEMSIDGSSDQHWSFTGDVDNSALSDDGGSSGGTTGASPRVGAVGAPKKSFAQKLGGFAKGVALTIPIEVDGEGFSGDPLKDGSLKLLGHELTHTVQQSTTISNLVITPTSMTFDVVLMLSDDDRSFSPEGEGLIELELYGETYEIPYTVTFEWPAPTWEDGDCDDADDSLRLLADGSIAPGSEVISLSGTLNGDYFPPDVASRLTCTCSPSWGGMEVQSFSASASGPVIHWQLEVRAIRVEMKRLIGGGGSPSPDLPLSFSFDGAEVMQLSCPLTVEIEEPAAPKFQFRPLSVDGAVVVEMADGAVSFDNTEFSVVVAVSGEGLSEDLELSSASFTLGGKGLPPELSKLSFTCEPGDVKLDKGQLTFEVTCTVAPTTGVFDPAKWSSMKALSGNMAVVFGGMDGSFAVSVPLQIETAQQAPLVKLIVPVAMDKGLRFRSFVVPHVLETSGTISFTLEGENFTDDMTVESLSLSYLGQDDDCDGFTLVVTSATTATLTCPLSPAMLESMLSSSEELTRMTVPSSTSLSMTATCVVDGESVSASFDMPVDVEVPEATFTASRSMYREVVYDTESESVEVTIEWSLDGMALFPELMTKTSFAILLDDGSSVSVEFDPASAEFAEDGSSVSFSSVSTVPIKKEEGGRHTPFHNKLMASSGSSSVEQEVSYELEMPELPAQLASVDIVSVSEIDLTDESPVVTIELRVGVLNPTADFGEGLSIAALNLDSISMASYEITVQPTFDLRTYQPGQPVYGNIVLTGQVTAERKDMLQWYNDRIGDKSSLSAPITITLQDVFGNAVTSAAGAAPLLWTAPEATIESIVPVSFSLLDSSSDEVTVTLSVSGQNLDTLRRENDTWSAEAFTVSIDGMPEARVSKVDAFTIKQGMTTEGDLVITLSGLAFADGHVFDKSTPKLLTRMAHSSGISFEGEIPLSEDFIKLYDKSTPKLSEIVVTKSADTDGDGYEDLLVTVGGEDCDDLDDGDLIVECTVAGQPIAAAWILLGQRATGFDLSVFGFNPEEIKAAARTAGGSSSSPSGEFELVCTVSIAPTVMGSSPGKPLSKSVVIPHILESNPKITGMSVASVTPLEDGESSEVTIVFDVEGEELSSYYGSKQKQWLTSNFRVRIDELEARIISLGLLTASADTATRGQFTMVVSVPVADLHTTAPGVHIKSVKLECRFIDESGEEISTEVDLPFSEALASRLSGEGGTELFDDTEGKEKKMLTSFTLISCSIVDGELSGVVGLDWSEEARKTEGVDDWHECFLSFRAVLPGGGEMTGGLEGDAIASFPQQITISCPDTEACLAQMRAAGWNDDEDCDITLSAEEYVAPRDSASGQASGRRDRGSGLSTGRRQYQPLLVRKRIDKASPLLMRMSSVSSETGDLDGDGVPEISSVSCVVEGENLGSLSAEDLVVSLDFGDGPVEVSVQGFVVNAHTSAFDLSVFGFDPVPISSSALRKSSSDGGPYLTVTLKEVMVSGITAPGGGSGGGGGGSVSSSISIPDYRDDDDDGDSVPTIDEELLLSSFSLGSLSMEDGGLTAVLSLEWTDQARKYEAADDWHECFLTYRCVLPGGAVLSATHGAADIVSFPSEVTLTCPDTSAALAMMRSSGWDEDQDCDGVIEVEQVVSPRDAASGLATGRRDRSSGLATGRRQHSPVTFSKRIDKMVPTARDDGTLDPDDDGDGVPDTARRDGQFTAADFDYKASSGKREITVRGTFTDMSSSDITDLAREPLQGVVTFPGGGMLGGVLSIDSSSEEWTCVCDENLSPGGADPIDLLIATGWEGPMCDLTFEVKSPRDAASGLATGRRSYTPAHFQLDLDGEMSSTRSAGQDHNSSRSNRTGVDQSDGQDHNSSRSNKSGVAAPDDEDGDSDDDSPAQDHNSSRSNKSGVAAPDDEDGDSDDDSPAQDHNSTRSNKSGVAAPDDEDGDTGSDSADLSKGGGTGMGTGKANLQDLHFVVQNGKLSATSTLQLDAIDRVDNGATAGRISLPGGGVLGGSCTVDPATGIAMCTFDENLTEGGADPLVLLVSSGWSGPQCDVTLQLESPRDAASGLSTGKRSPGDPPSGQSSGRRQYEPIRHTADLSIPVVYSSISYGEPVVSAQEDGSFTFSCPFTLEGELLHLAPPTCVVTDPVSGTEITCVVTVSSSSSSSMTGGFTFSSGPRQSTSTDGTRYNMFEAWPCRWKAPELNSSSDTHIVEEIEFAVEKVERARTAPGGEGDPTEDDTEEDVVFSVDSSSVVINRRVCTCPLGYHGRLAPGTHDVTLTIGGVVFSGSFSLEQESSEGQVVLSLEAPESADLSTLSGQLEAELSVTSPRDAASGLATGKRSVTSPRDAASGLATGKRMHKPLKIIIELDRMGGGDGDPTNDDTDTVEEALLVFTPGSLSMDGGRLTTTCELVWSPRSNLSLYNIRATFPGGVVLEGECECPQGGGSRTCVLVDLVSSPTDDPLARLASGGWDGGPLEAAIEYEVKTSRDAGSGLATGRRQHKPVTFSPPITRGEDAPLESMKFTYQKIEWIYTSDDSGELLVELEVEGSPEQLAMLSGAQLECKISEIKMEIETIEFRSGMDTGLRKLIGSTKVSNIQLTPAMIESGSVDAEFSVILAPLDASTMAGGRKDMLDWYQDMVAKGVARKNITINLRQHQSEKGLVSREAGTDDSPITSASVIASGTENGVMFVDLELSWRPAVQNFTAEFLNGRYVLRAGVPLRSMTMSTEFDVEGGSPPSTVRLYEDSPVSGVDSLSELRSSSPDGMDLELNYEVTSPRDAASGQATGKRTHKPLRMRMDYGATEGAAATQPLTATATFSDGRTDDSLAPGDGTEDGGDDGLPLPEMSFSFGKVVWYTNDDKRSASMEVDFELEGSPEQLSAMSGASFEISSPLFEDSVSSVIEFKDGDDPVTHKRAGKAKYKNIVLKRGLVNDSSFEVSGVVLPVVSDSAARSGSDGSMVKKIRDWVKLSYDKRTISTTFEVDATGPAIRSGQPAIVDNEKGLLVSFSLIYLSPEGTSTVSSELDFSSAPEAARTRSGHRIVFDDRDNLVSFSSPDDAPTAMKGSPLYDAQGLEVSSALYQSRDAMRNALSVGGEGGQFVFNPMSGSETLYLCPLLSIDGSETAVGISLSDSPSFEGYTVLYNPREYTITKSTPWKHHDIQGLDAPTAELVGGVLPGGAVISAAVSCTVAGGGSSSVIVDFNLDGMQDVVIAGRSAGAGNGFYFIPEVGDEVVVSFDSNNVPIVKGSALGGNGQRGPGGGGSGGTVIVLGSLWNGKDAPKGGILLSDTPRMSVNMSVAKQSRFSITPIITADGQLLLELSSIDGPTGSGGMICGDTEHFFMDNGDSHEQEADAVADRLGVANGGVERPGTHVHGDPHVDLHVVTFDDNILEVDEEFFAVMVSFTSPDDELSLDSLPALEAVLMVEDEEVSSMSLKPSLSPDGGGWYSGALDLSDVEDGSSFSVVLRLMDSSSSVSLDGKPVEGEVFSSISNVLKTKHDTAKNSVGNIR